MVDDSLFRRVVEDDLGKLRLVLKAKVASLEEIKKEEENLIGVVRRVIASVKEIEAALEKEVELFKKLGSGWEKAYRERRWEAIGAALKQEVENFNQEYVKTKDMFESCSGLVQRLEGLREVLKRMNARNAESREQDLKMLEDFRKQKEGGAVGVGDKYEL